MDLDLGVADDREAGTAQHGFGTGAIRYPPIGRIVGIAVLDEMQPGIVWPVEWLDVPEIVILGDWARRRTASLHRLEDEHVSCDVLVDEVEGKQRMTQVIENAEKEDDVESLPERSDIVDGELAELDVELLHPGGKARLIEIGLVAVDAENAC